MMELAARRDAGVPVSAQTIAERRAIPEKYLTHILLQLKRSNLVRSVRGAQGGYMLEVHPGRISLLQIVESIDGPIMAHPHQENSDYHELDSVWETVTREVAAVLAGITLEKMVEMTPNGAMFHI